MDKPEFTQLFTFGMWRMRLKDEYSCRKMGNRTAYRPNFLTTEFWLLQEKNFTKEDNSFFQHLITNQKVANLIYN